MGRKFSITTPTSLSRADAEGHVQVVFTVANASGMPERRLFRAVPLGDAQESWLSLGGAAEREFAAEAVHQISVSAKVPPATSAGRYGFRLDTVSASRSGEDIEEGPAVYFDVAGAAPPKKSMAWLWIVVVLAVLLLGGAGTWLALRPVEAPEVVTEPAGTIPVADVATPRLAAADAMRALQDLGFQTKLRFERNDEVKAGSVYEQLPAANTRAASGSAVELTVALAEEDSLKIPEADQKQLSAGTEDALHEFFLRQRRVEVPDLTTNVVDVISAVRMLQISGLNVAIKTNPSATADSGTVVSQQPEAKSEVRVGSTVTIWVAGDGQVELSEKELAHLTESGAERLHAAFTPAETDSSSTQ